MAYNILCEKSDLVAIANAIRSKNGKTESYKVNQLASAVESIKGGITTENKLAQILNKSITTVTAEDLQGATIIKARAFQDCSSLASITIPSSVTSIKYYAFASCNGLMSITIPDSVTSIGGYAFYDCSSLTSIIIPNSVTSVESNTFYSCSGLTSVTIGNSVTRIGSNAFYDCSSLTSITIPDSVTSIEYCAFSGCNSLTSVTIGSGVTSIDEEAFVIGSPTNKATIIMKRTTPPIISSDIFYTDALNKIIVPKGTGNRYKSARNWSYFASYIQEATT